MGSRRVFNAQFVTKVDQSNNDYTIDVNRHSNLSWFLTHAEKSFTASKMDMGRG
jgi:hypothetical protein